MRLELCDTVLQLGRVVFIRTVHDDGNYVPNVTWCSLTLNLFVEKLSYGRVYLSQGWRNFGGGGGESGGSCIYRVADATASLIFLYSSATFVGDVSTNTESSTRPYQKSSHSISAPSVPRYHLLPHNSPSLAVDNIKLFFLYRRHFHKMWAFGRGEGNWFTARIKIELSQSIYYLFRKGTT